MPVQSSDIGPVVSAAHLAVGALPELSEIEFALTVLGNAFQRWMVRCMAAAGQSGLTATDILVLHAVNHRGRDKSLADLCMIYNFEDTHIVAYALRKLAALELVESGRRGKAKTARVTSAGEAVCRRYRDIREALLVSAATSLRFDPDSMSALAGLMRALSGQYDQAARGAASL